MTGRVRLVVLAGLGALPARCLALAPSEDPPVRILEVLPSELSDREPLEVILSAPVHWIEPGGGVEVWGADGEPAPHLLTRADTGRSLRLEPDPRWPVGPALGLRLRGGFIGSDGRALSVDTSTRSVPRRPGAEPPPVPRVARLAPSSGHAAPRDLTHVGLLVEPPVALPEVALRLRDHVVRLVPEVQEQGRVRARIEGDLRPGRWTLEAPSGFRAPAGLEGELDVAPADDPGPPRLEAWSHRIEAGAIVFHCEADEPFFVRGRAETEGGIEVPVRGPPFALRSAAIRVEVAAPEVAHRIELELVDLSGRVTSLRPLTLRSAPELQIEITEIVTTPLRDWGDSEEAGRPFDGLPGDGSVSDADEWVELVNRSDRALDLSTVDVRLETMDGTPAVTILSEPPGAYFGAGGDGRSWLPGEAMVVRPRGSMSSRDLWVRVVSGERVLHDVRLADEAGEHPGGAPPDSWRESVAWSVWGRWSWCRPSPGDPAASTDCSP